MPFQSQILLQERSRLPAPGDANELSVIEGQLTWLVHIIAAILKIRQTIGCRWEINIPCFLPYILFDFLFFSLTMFILLCSQESQELIDAELAARVLQLINVTDTGVHAQVRWKWFGHLTWKLSAELVYL